MADELEIVKARNDLRDYRRIVLQNKLQILLISDSHTDKCAASMEVCVGSFSDPDGLEGLAHLLEHMLFYASEKYPLKDSYSEYISQNGGSTNAYTSTTYANFHFDVNPDGFEEALDRFAQFFIKPLMPADAIVGEIEIVDSEHNKNLLSDEWRMGQLQKHTCVKGHPYHRFITGNQYTLEMRPKERGVDIRKELLRFYSENYSANLMHVVVYCKDGLDISERMVRSKFEDIKNTDRLIHFSGQPCDAETLQILVKAVPIEQGHRLFFEWPISARSNRYQGDPIMYLEHLIGHEGKGSVIYTLKRLGWARNLSAGESAAQHEFSFFNVNIHLTDAGQEHFEDIVALLFKYIDLLQQYDPKKWIFDELAAIHKNSFHYQDKIQPLDYVVKVATDMKFYPPKYWLVGSSLPSKFVPENIESVLKQLNPYNVRIFWESINFEGHTNLTEPWYGTAYSLERLNGSIIEQWIGSAPNEDLHLPAPNVFIPTDLSLKTVSEQINLPVLQRNTQYSRLWYKPDTFSIPKANLKINFHCPMAGRSPESIVLTEFFTHLLKDNLDEDAYDAQLAGLYYEVNRNDYGFQVAFDGFNHKLKVLLEIVIQQIAEFEVKPENFAGIQESFMEECQNFMFQQPYEQAMYYCSLILQDRAIPWTEQLEVLSHLQVEDLVKFYPSFLSRIFLECYAAGNLYPSEAESMIQNVEDVFFKGSKPSSWPMLESQHMTNRILKLERGINYLFSVKGLNPSDENSAIVHYIQVHQDDFKMNVLVQLFEFIAKQPAFHHFRSVEKLGYIAELMERNDTGIRGVQFIIQSTKVGPRQIELSIESFLKKFETELYEMPADEFESNVNELVKMKLEKHKNLGEESGFYVQEISDGTLIFDRKEREVAALKRLSQNELIDFFNTYIKVGAPCKKSLSIRVYGSKHSSEYEADNSETAPPKLAQIDDICTFKRNQPLYGSCRGFHKDGN